MPVPARCFELLFIPPAPLAPSPLLMSQEPLSSPRESDQRLPFRVYWVQALPYSTATPRGPRSPRTYSSTGDTARTHIFEKSYKAEKYLKWNEWCRREVKGFNLRRGGTSGRVGKWDGLEVCESSLRKGEGKGGGERTGGKKKRGAGLGIAAHQRHTTGRAKPQSYRTVATR